MPGRRKSRAGPPSSRLAGLVGGDLAGYRREPGDGGWVRFVPSDDGPTIEMASRVEKRFLGRTEVAVFSARLDVTVTDESVIVMRHTGGLKRTGVTAVLERGAGLGERLASALASDPGLEEALMPLDFTRFQVFCGPTGCRCEVELMGASHVAIALPPIRSYVHLYPDQRKALTRGIEEVRRVLRRLSG